MLGVTSQLEVGLVRWNIGRILVLGCLIAGLGVGLGLCSVNLSAVEAGVTVEVVPSTWDEDDLFHQPRMQEFKALAREYGFLPRSTAWQPTDLDPLNLSSGTPGELLAAFTLHLINERLCLECLDVTVRTLKIRPDQALGAILVWGFEDDSVLGADFRVTMALVEAEDWRVTRVEQRFHCARGGSEELCL